ncbi:hypothetical protein E2F48_15020 [Arthrobacter crusticola]|uniref:Uncharacterized protein n=1 Tax=Arthrobacter crusticola TaxID=2547960 RepID=A0A4R5TS18_9MICC|nr:hypothetical protein [Arthrobacter crusticola]TDK24087.1 hypothetical protein E2F48_15020 [Arthrobacter crusticola]
MNTSTSVIGSVMALGAGATVLLTPQFVLSRHVVALVFAVGSTRPVLVMKVPRCPGDNEGVRRETDMLRRLGAAGA